VVSHEGVPRPWLAFDVLACVCVCVCVCLFSLSGMRAYACESSKEPYRVTAHKDGYTFSTTIMKCPKPGVFVNAPPPAGPQVISPPQ